MAPTHHPITPFPLQPSTSTSPKKVMLLSRLDGNNLVRLIEIIRQAGCKVVLVATAIGYNYSLNEENYNQLGIRIRAVYSTIVDPPPLVTVTGVSQLIPFLEALDPDLVISFRFPYQLTKSFLSHRSIKINGHPGPLPLYKGGNGFSRAVLQQVPRWGVTWHYTAENYDAGNILSQEFFDLQSPYGIEQIVTQSEDLLFELLDKTIKMSLSGHVGSPQRQATADEEEHIDAKALTLAERTIKDGSSCHEVWKLVEAAKYHTPALLNVEDRLYHVTDARRLETPVPFTLKMGEVKRVINRFVQQCSDGQMEYVVRIV